jgi:hypothetical protein
MDPIVTDQPMDNPKLKMRYPRRRKFHANYEAVGCRSDLNSRYDDPTFNLDGSRRALI